MCENPRGLRARIRRLSSPIDRIVADFARKLGIRVNAYEEDVIEHERVAKEEAHHDNIICSRSSAGSGNDKHANFEQHARNGHDGEVTRGKFALRPVRDTRSSPATRHQARRGQTETYAAAVAVPPPAKEHYYLIGTTPLRHICARLDQELVKFLVKRGAVVHLTNESEWSCLEICAPQNHAALVASIIARQAQVSQLLRYRIVRLLLRANINVNVNMSTKYDKPTLHAAVLKGQFPVCPVLIKYNADTNKADRN